MTGRTVTRIVVLGALTGMRSMAGLATLARAQRGVASPVMALVAAHLAYHGRQRLPLSSVGGGLLEDGLVIAIASRCT